MKATTLENKALPTNIAREIEQKIYKHIEGGCYSMSMEIEWGGNLYDIEFIIDCQYHIGSNDFGFGMYEILDYATISQVNIHGYDEEGDEISENEEMIMIENYLYNLDLVWEN